MLNLKKSKIYKVLKLISFSFLYYILKTLSINNRLFYLSKWVRDNGDDRLLVNYPINSKGTILDVGGYTGVFSDKILLKHNCKLIIFEPVKEYYKILKNKYLKDKRVKVFNYGLSKNSTLVDIYISNDGTSLVKRSEKTERIELVNVSSFFKQLKKVDLMSINIEGAEYDVLSNLIKTGNIEKIKFLQVQFHDFMPNSKVLREVILRQLKKTHKLRFSYPFVWESFSRIN